MVIHVSPLQLRGLSSHGSVTARHTVKAGGVAAETTNRHGQPKAGGFSFPRPFPFQ